MKHPICEYVFRPMPEIWTDASTGKVLADVLQEYEIVVDDRAQFCRLYDYERMVSIWYRAFAQKITLTIWQIQ